jgi:photosystem II stability/assembly factor-like uncharacterized protein
MKKYLLLSIVLFLNGLTSFSQWVVQPSGTSVFLKSVYFPNADTGYIVGNSGMILYTSNGGNLWTQQNSGTNNNLVSVYFPEANTGYAVGDAGTILKTTNGGILWTSQNSGTTNSLKSICFPDAEIGYAVGGAGTIQKTTNGGGIWTSQNSGTSMTLNSVYFTDSSAGYAVGDSGIILKTANGGASWTIKNSGTNSSYHLYSIQFPNANTGYAAGIYREFYQFYYNGCILKTIDAGETWSIIKDELECVYNSIYFTDEDTGYVDGQISNICKTTDGGANWTSESYGALNSIYFTDANTGYAVGWNGLILKTTNGGGPPVGINEKTQTTSLKIYPNPAKGKIIIEPTGSGSNMNGTVSLYGLSGQEMIRQQVQGSKVEINVSSLPTGIYFIRLENNNKNEFGKFVKE